MRKKLGLSVWIQESKSGVEAHLTSKLEVLTPNLPRDPRPSGFEFSIIFRIIEIITMTYHNLIQS